MTMRERDEAGEGSRGPSMRGTTGRGGKLKFCSKGLGKTLRVFKQGSEM